MNEINAITTHMYQDGNDLIVVYSNVFNNDYSLEDIIKNQITQRTGFIPIPTVTPGMPKIITFPYIGGELYKRFTELGGMTQYSDGGSINYVTSESAALEIENQLHIRRNED